MTEISQESETLQARDELTAAPLAEGEQAPKPVQSEAAPAPAAPTPEALAAEQDRQAYEMYRAANPFTRSKIYDQHQAAIERGRVLAAATPAAADTGARPNPFAEARERLRNMK